MDSPNDRTATGGRARQAWQRASAEPIAFHITIRLSDDRVIAGTIAERRRAAGVVLRHGRSRGLFGFRLADNHGHLLARCSREEAGALAATSTTSLRKQLSIPVPFEPARIRPITDQRHGYNALPYVLRQEVRHGIELDRTHEASNLQDLLGLRVVGHYTIASVRSLLPRFDWTQLWSIFGVVDLEHATEDFERLADAAAAAFGLVGLRGRRAPAVNARHAAVHAVGRALADVDTTTLLGISRRTLVRMRATPCDARAVRAVTLQLKYRGAFKPLASPIARL